VQASGPRGHLTKEDLINFIEKNKLTKVNQLDNATFIKPVAEAAPIEKAKKAPAPKKAQAVKPGKRD
jgi:hypothetical protein